MQGSLGLLFKQWLGGLQLKSFLLNGAHALGFNAPGDALAAVGKGKAPSLRLRWAIEIVMEQLETRILYSWVGATSGNTNDAAHDYNNAANWTGGVINDNFSTATLTANTTLYFSANRTTTAGMNLGYAGNFDLTFESNNTTARTLTLSGNITGDFGGAANSRTVTIGDAVDPLNIDLGGATRTLNANTGDTLAVSNVISNGGLVKAGGGTLTVTGANTYTGGTAVNAGTLQAINGTGATSDITPTPFGDTTTTVTVASGATVWLDHLLGGTNNIVIYANNFSGAGTVKVTAPGAASASSAQLSGTLSGLTGTLDLFPNSANFGKIELAGTTNGDQPAASATIKVEAGTTLYLTSGLTYASSIRLFGGGNSEGYGALRFQNATTVSGSVTLMADSSFGAHSGVATGSITGVVSDGGNGYSFDEGGSGAIALSGANTYSGGTTVFPGAELDINGSSAIGTGLLTINSGATIDNTSGGAITLSTNNTQAWNGDFTFNGSNPLNLGTGTATMSASRIITTGGSAALTVGGVITDGASTFSLTETGTGTLAVTGANNYGGGTFINGGTLSFANTSLSTGNVTFSGNGTLQWNGSNTQDVSSKIQAIGSGITATFDTNGNNVTLASVLSGAGGIAKVGAGALTLPAANTFAGGAMLTVGQLNINNAAAIGPGTFTINGGTIDNTSGGSITLSNNNAQSWNGDFTFAGTNPLNLGTGAVTLGGNRQITTTANTLTVGGNIGGAFSIAKAGAGTLALGGASTYSGGTVVLAGILQAYNASGGTSSITPTPLGSTSSTATVNSGATLWLDYLLGATNNNVTYAYAFGGAGTLKVTAPGSGGTASTSILTGSLSGFTGILDLFPNSGSNGKIQLKDLTNGDQPSASATIKIESGTTLFLSTGLTYSSNIQIYSMGNGENLGALRIEGGTTISGNVTLMANGSVGSNSGLGTITGVISDGGNGYSLTKEGSGEIALSAANTYSGGTTLSTGKLDINNAAALGGGAFTIGDATTIDNTSGGAITLSNNNAQTWGGDFTFSGANSLNLGTGAVTLGASSIVTAIASTLTEGGIISGAFSLTKAGAGTLALSGANTFSGGDVINAGTELINNASGSGAGTGAVTVNASGTLGGTGGVSGSVTVNSGGTLSPGVAGSAVFATGNLTIAAGGNLNADINSSTAGTGYDQVNVTGTVNLSGNLNLFGTRTVHAGDPITLINNDAADAVTGTFAGLAEGAVVALNGVNYTISYHGGTGNDVVLTDASPSVATAAAASPSTVTGTSSALSVLGASSAGESSLTYTWLATAKPAGSTPVYSLNGTNAAKNSTVTFDRYGSYTFTVTISDGTNSVSSSVSVTVSQTLTSIAVAPGTAGLNENGSQQFSAVANDQFGIALSSQPGFAWSRTSGIGSISGTGLYTAPGAAGTATVQASSGGINGTASVTITNAAPTVATAASASPSTVTGTSSALSVLGADDGGESNLTYTWLATAKPAGSTPVYSLNGTNAAKNSTVTFDRYGSYTFT
ncbi:MAG: autotransporter-associated beta strand repeat-containing protein, partial [Planctomycetota bacterium]|nr:autotransporter-associated beta strand repeat-containing protein [Planctomycetota bacterium]